MTYDFQRIQLVQERSGLRKWKVDMFTHVKRVHVLTTPLRRSEGSSDVVSHDLAHKMAAAKWSNSVRSKEEAEDVYVLDQFYSL